MTMIRWNSPSRSLVRVHDDWDRWFDGLFDGRGAGRDLPTLFAPPVDIDETAEAFVLRVDLPGVSSQDVKVSVLGDTLTIRGERKSETAKNSRRTERVHGTFERTFTLGATVSGDRVQATYKDGVLEIQVPKAEAAKAREIEVKIAS